MSLTQTPIHSNNIYKKSKQKIIPTQINVLQDYVNTLNKPLKKPKKATLDKEKSSNGLHEFIIERQLVFEDWEYVQKLYSNYKLNLYIVTHPRLQTKYLYISSKKMVAKTNINSMTAQFLITPNFDNDMNFKHITDINGFVFLMPTPNESDLKLNLKEITHEKKAYKQPDGSFNYVLKNKELISTGKIILDNPYLPYLKLKKVRKPKLLISDIENGLVLDSHMDRRIKNIVISTLFRTNNKKLMMFNDHTLLMDRGGTGKSSIVGVVNAKLDDVSNAGLFGWADVKNNRWQTGIVEKTSQNIMIDEIDQYFKENRTTGIISKFNTFAENGIHCTAKAVPHTIESSKQVTIVGNIKSDIHFDDQLNKLFDNIETVGRRFGNFIYEENMIKAIGKKIRPTSESEIKYLSEYIYFISYIYEYYMLQLNIHEKLFNNKIINAKFTEFITKLNRIVNDEAFESAQLSKKFISNFVGSKRRIISLALKLVIYEHGDTFIKNELIPNYKLFEHIYPKFNEVCNDIIISCENLLRRVKQEMPDLNSSQLFFNGTRGKYEEEFIHTLFINMNESPKLREQKRFTANDITYKFDSNKHQIMKLKRRNLWNSFNMLLSNYGLKIQHDEENKYIVHIYKTNVFDMKLNEWKNLYGDTYGLEVKNIQDNQKEKKSTQNCPKETKHDIDDVDMIDMS